MVHADYYRWAFLPTRRSELKISEAKRRFAELKTDTLRSTRVCGFPIFYLFYNNFIPSGLRFVIFYLFNDNIIPSGLWFCLSPKGWYFYRLNFSFNCQTPKGWNYNWPYCFVFGLFFSCSFANFSAFIFFWPIRLPNRNRLMLCNPNDESRHTARN